MTEPQEAHLEGVKARFCKEIDPKYRGGQRDNGGDLWEKKGVVKMMREEALDQVTYTDVLIQQFKSFYKILNQLVGAGLIEEEIAKRLRDCFGTKQDAQ